MMRVADCEQIRRDQFNYVMDANGRPAHFHFWPPSASVPLCLAITPYESTGGQSWLLTGRLDAPTVMPLVAAADHQGREIWRGLVQLGEAISGAEAVG